MVLDGNDANIRVGNVFSSALEDAAPLLRGGEVSLNALLEMLLICNCHLGKLLFEFDD